MNETENVSRRQFLGGGISVLLGGLLGGLAGHVTADVRLKEEANSAPAAAEKEGDRLPIDVLSGAILDPDPKSDRFGGSLVNKTGWLTQYIHVYPGLEVRLSRPTAEGERVCWMGYDGSLSKAVLLVDSRTGEEDGEADTVLTIPEGIAFLRGSSRDGESRPEVRVESLAEYSLRCGLGRPDLTGYTEVSPLTLYPYSRKDADGRFDENRRLCPAIGDVFFTPIGTDIIMTFRDANIAPFLHCGENWVNIDQSTVFSRCLGFGYAWYQCRTTNICNWLSAGYETFGGCARMLTTEELLAADPHFYIRLTGQAVPSREAARIRTKGVSDRHERLFTVVHLTDTHGDIDSIHAAYEYADQIGADLIAMTGDYVPYHPDHGYDMVHSMIRKARTPTVYTIGNHDVKEYPDRDAYEKNIAPIRDALQASEEHPYYYRDFQYQNDIVRVISLYPFYDGAKHHDRGYYTKEQLEWLCETMSSVPDGGHILILRHFAHNKPAARDYNHLLFYDYQDSVSEAGVDSWLSMIEDPVPVIVDAYNRRETISAQFTGVLKDNITETITVDYDFTSRPNSEFVAYVTGHVHIDAVGYARGSKTSQAVLCSLCTTGVKGTDEYKYTTPDTCRDYGTDSQIAFNVFAFDFRNRTIYTARVGNGTCQDREKTWMELPY